MDPLIALVLILVMAAGAWWWFGHAGAAREAEMRLRRICLGDQSQVEQLIAAEMARSPGITRAEAAHRAVMRYERDNR